MVEQRKSVIEQCDQCGTVWWNRVRSVEQCGGTLEQYGRIVEQYGGTEEQCAGTV